MAHEERFVLTDHLLVRVRVEDGVGTIALRGTLDAASAPALHKAVASLRATSRVVLDLSGATVDDDGAATVRTLAAAHEDLELRGGSALRPA